MTTYMMRADGEAANKGAAEDGDPAVVSECMNISVHNGETFDEGDTILLTDQGGVFRGQITTPSSGSSGSRIVYDAESGDSPIVSAADLITTWTGGPAATP